MTPTERARHHKRRRTHAITAAVIAASTVACTTQPAKPAATPAQLTNDDVRQLYAAQAARPTSTPRRPARIGNATVVRRLRTTVYCEGTTTYTGHHVFVGLAAVKASSGIPFGAVLHVEGHRYVVDDREPEYGASSVDLYWGYLPDCERRASVYGIRRLPVQIERAAA